MKKNGQIEEFVIYTLITIDNDNNYELRTKKLDYKRIFIIF